MLAAWMSASEAAKAFRCTGVSAYFGSSSRGGRGRLFFLVFLFLFLFFRLLGFPSALGLRPVVFEYVAELLRGRALLDDDADFATFVELERPQAHTAKEHVLPVAQHGAQMQPKPGHLLGFEPFAFFGD